MKTVKTIEDFYKHNHRELEKSIRYISKLNVKEEVDDIAQLFYLRIIESKSLEKYDPQGKARFNTYIWNVIYWVVLDYYASNNRRLSKKKVKPEMFVDKNDPMDLEEEIWSKIGEFDGELEIDPDLKASFATAERSKEILANLESFKDYLRNLKEKEKKKEQMIKCIEMMDYGYKGIEIAKEFGVSSTMIKEIKKYVQGHYDKWNKRMDGKFTHAA